MKEFDPEAITGVGRDTLNRFSNSYDNRVAKQTGHAVDFLIEAARLTEESRALEIGLRTRPHRQEDGRRRLGGFRR